MRFNRIYEIVDRNILSHTFACFLSLCVGIVSILFSSSVKAELRAGAARVSITPDVQAEHIPLGGYAARRGAPSTGVHDPVYARAVALSEGTHRVFIVSLDLCFLPANIQTDVRERLKTDGKGDFDQAYLFLAATHTHSAPDPLAMHAGNKFKASGWTSYDATLRAFTASRIASAIEEANRKLAPALVGSVISDDTGKLNRNRRQDPIVDPAMTVVKITGADGKPIADIVDFASHPTLYGDEMREVSADWPGTMTAAVEHEMGSDGVCLFLNGAEGDASPNGVDDLKGDAKVQEYGRRVGETALKLLAKAMPVPNAALSAWSEEFKLPARRPTAQFLLAAGQLGLDMKDAKALVNDLMPTTTAIRFVKLGDLLLIGFPCEPTGALGLAAKAEAAGAGYAQSAVVALVDDWLAYALMPEQYREGKYETMMSFYGDQFGPTLLDAIKTGLSASHK